MIATFDFNGKTNMCSVSLDSQDAFNRLRSAFSTPNKNKKFSHGANSWMIADRFYFITPTGKFRFGLAESILKWLSQNIHDTTVEYKLSDAFKARLAKDDEAHEIYKGLSFQPREYQEEAVRLALHHRYGTFVMGTGAGKTLTISYILENLFRLGKIKRALIVVPDNGLVTQFNDELFNQYGMQRRVCLFYDKHNKVDPDCEIVIANRPLLLSRFAANEKFFTKEIDCLVVDEAHSIKKGNKISKCLEKVQATYRFGFTGTLAEEPEDKMRCFGALGPVRYQITSKELRDDGFLADVAVHAVTLNYQKAYPFGHYRDEVQFLQGLPSRNDFLKKLCFALPKNSLLLVNFLAHGFELEELFKSYNETLPEGERKEVFFIRGEVENETREEIKRLMEERGNIVCIAITKIFSTGINIKNIHNVILAAGGKSSVTVVQSIGRGLRLHPEKKRLDIWDIADGDYPYSMEHREKRLTIYAQEKIRVEEHPLELK